MMADNKLRSSKMEDSEIIEDINDLFRTETDPSRIIREIGWFRNILFYLGEQWISWFEKQNTFGYRFSLNMGEPTPVSNIIREHVRSMKALIINKKYATRIWPNSEEQRDKDAAELGGILLRHLESVRCNEIEDIKEMVALWTVLVGNAFARTYTSLDTGCYVLDKNKNVLCKGDIVVENLIPFNVAVPLLGDVLRDKRMVGIKALKLTEWVEDTFKIKIASGDKEDADYGVEYEKQLMTLVSNVSPWKGRGIHEGEWISTANNKMTLFKEIEYRPTKRYPRGRYVAVVGNQVVAKRDELPISVTKEGEWEYTVSDFKYNHTPGSFWATSGVDDLISPQTIINEVDRALASNRKSVGRPYVLTPTDLIMKRKSMAGQSFLQLEYDSRSSGGQKPEVNRGTAFPQQVLEERRLHVEGAQQAAGDPKNILRGQAPGSGFSGISIDILRESAELSHTPDIERFYRSWNRVKKKQLILAKDTYTESRILKVAGEGNKIIIKSFVGANLYDNTDVRLEIDSGISTTRAGANEFMMNLIQNKFFGDVSQRPDIQYELLKRFGMSWIPVATSVHEERASAENGIIAVAGKDDIAVELGSDRVPIPLLDGIFYAKHDEEQGEPVVMSNDRLFKFDDHQIHYDEHVKTILSKEFSAWPPANQLILIGHTDIHKMAITAKEQADMQRQAAAETLKAEQPSPNRPLDVNSAPAEEPIQGPGSAGPSGPSGPTGIPTPV
jgi:hypothetical protein